MKTAILTPLQEELTCLIAEFEHYGLQKNQTRLGILDAFEFPDLGLLVACGGHGKTQFGIQAQYLLSCEPQIELLICAGAAGALSESLEIGDLVVALGTVEHDYRLKFASRPLPRFGGDRVVIDSFRQLSKTSLNFSVHFGAIASGDEDVIDPVRGQEIVNLTDGIAVAWEGAGGARACRFSGKRFVELRGVTDTADHNAATDFETNLATAMNHLGQFIIRWRENLIQSRPIGAANTPRPPQS